MMVGTGKGHLFPDVDPDAVNAYLHATASTLGDCFRLGEHCAVALTVGAVAWLLAAAWGKFRD
jgi:hypothetical protein